MSIIRYELSKILEQEQDRIWLWIPAVFAAGILLYFWLPIEPSLWWSAVIIEIMIVLAYLWRYQIKKLVILGWLSVFILGFVNIQVRAYYLNTIPLLKNEETVYLKGYVQNTGYNYRGKKYMILDHMCDFDNKPIKGKYRITPLQSIQNIHTGDCIETVASMRPLMMPNMMNGYQFNRQQFFNGLKATGYTDVSVHKISCHEIGVKTGKFLPFIEQLRSKITTFIYHTLPPETASIAAAVIAGERGRISHQQAQEYRDAGLAHFLAISGLHMGMIAGMMFLLVRWILACFPKIALCYDTKKIAAVFAIVFSFIYLVISGWQISTQRAFIMTFFVLLGVLVGRRAISMRMVAWAGLILLIIEPQVLISAGFQMSFAAVVMLVAFYEKYAIKVSLPTIRGQHTNHLLKFLRIIGYYLIGILAADFVASLATLPFVIYHFNRISVYTSLANLLAGPIIGLWIMPMVLIVLLLMPFGLAKYPLLLTGYGINLVNQIAQKISHLDYASWQVLSMQDWGLLLIVVGGLWLAIWQKSWRHFGWLFIIAGFLSILTIHKPLLLADEGAKTFAVQDNFGKMVILPNRGNYFTKQMWQEKLAETQMNENKRQKLNGIYKGKIEDRAWLSLKCGKESCIFQNYIQLNKKGGIRIKGKDYSGFSPLMVYKTKSGYDVQRIYEVFGKRYWTDIDLPKNVQNTVK